MASGPVLDWSEGTVRRNIRAIMDGAPKEFGRAMYQEINEVETPECQARCPVKTGLLRSTIRTVGPDYTNKTIKVGTIAGGPGVEYAIPVHENTGVYHPNGQAKFIESVYRESGRFLLRRVADRVRLAKLTQRGAQNR